MLVGDGWRVVLISQWLFQTIYCVLLIAITSARRESVRSARRNFVGGPRRFVTDFAMGSFIVLMAGMKLSIEVAPSFVHLVKFLSATSNCSQVSSVSFFWNRTAIRLISRSNSNSVEIYGQFIE